MHTPSLTKIYDNEHKFIKQLPRKQWMFNPIKELSLFNYDEIKALKYNAFDRQGNFVNIKNHSNLDEYGKFLSNIQRGFYFYDVKK